MVSQMGYENHHSLLLHLNISSGLECVALERHSRFTAFQMMTNIYSSFPLVYVYFDVSRLKHIENDRAYLFPM